MSASVYDRFNIHAQLEHLQSKYTGTGHADTTKWQWGSTIRRDTLASHVGHHSRLMYFAVAKGQTIARIRYQFLSDLARPCGPQQVADIRTLVQQHHQQQQQLQLQLQQQQA
eukprot:Gregarina_sp_Poly_1__1254@NODE_1303_length_4431_cov_1311_404675_g882_i0_p3_GENE_NODE_1303_length_4431_cov_1311_404675_g882_i0NODE_1303_length_4431_cov_1311_404675_g882_i0_p3_ORF_typecomplete_len112_score11_48SF3b10/PF07189_11/1e34SF3b10/PF07189_11/1_8e04Longin/PF13774_6/0_27EspB/PF05802_11/1Activator_LAG3/PF11498_8/6_NODE_1303_length_4431_cov_1311_404675_g882_i040674402